MDESTQVQNRRQRRANVLLTAVIELSGRSVDVKLRNLSSDGALVDAPDLPVEGAEIRFKRGDLVVDGKLIWVRGNRGGIQFHRPLSPEALLRHVPVPRPRVLPDFRRPGLAAKPLTEGELTFGTKWLAVSTRDAPGD
ncbi:PilZ domain-containing protein [Sphingomonas sp. LHG3406-1]|uniref:PilZ domain-containing protein n=1 Tax=Sphingomonas sp. LHG3406-1 TaxID=2804617 RepID=UPI0026344131|nr:PilZ domain-containing protein [Sphingomonas sp. LHG3406-1]